MWDIRNQIVDAAKKFNVEIEEINDFEKIEFLKEIESKYLSTDLAFPLWDRLKGGHSKQHENAWRWVKDYIKNERAILFFNEGDEQGIYELNSGEDVVNILGEIFNIEFYLSNRETGYLLCYNHHDFLVASGDAKEWLQDYKEK